MKDMTAEEALQLVVELCADHGQVESVFLTPHPEHYVFTFTLFDSLHERTGIPKEKIAAWFEAAQIARAKREGK